MNRRRFLKNVGMAVIGLGLVGSAQANKTQTFMGVPVVRVPAMPSMQDERHSQAGFVSNEAFVWNVDSVNMNCCGWVNHEAIRLPMEDGSFICFPPETVMFGGASGHRDSLEEPFITRFSLTARLTGKFNETYPMYNLGNVGKIIDGLKWSEIKE